MRFIQFTSKNGGPQQLGVQLKQGGDIVILSTADSQIPNMMTKFLEGGEDLFKKAKKIVAEKRNIIAEDDVNFLAPITCMDKVFCIGLNYAEYCLQQGKSVPESPIVFSKFPSTTIGPYDNIQIPQISDKVDWEAELTIVIGKKCKNLSNNAEDCIFGYTAAQDISARDWQRRNGGQFLLGKAMDTFCPLGPVIVTKEAISDIDDLSIRTWVNGVIKQDGNTSELIFKPPQLVAYISQFMTLLPGDIILTGTPAGVGFTRKPPEFLQRGDVLETEIEDVGRLKNNVV
ncbi:fumarylacetoacetate hydrolase domain-containing protein 2-like isoform X2 [Cataglyphis hispanica]|uniref:fumarylacetoacetate hydrolase domain-containing protein 2-like isoform X2 n=2 Tax=Cataglyphis hispanica TaxID=1086592 RepID=UPI00218010EF|nr:fumarylacetoacetate hydrolase domain-containing protein 2-like isoform X2 [Cataglyphis hispanica]